ncbi:unnamed protein product [Discula destructiva]
MYFSTLLPLSALVLHATAATVPRQDPHIVDFRTFGAPGCFEENQGIYTYLQSDLDKCKNFADATIGSIFVGDITDGCSLYAYTDFSCMENQVTVPVGIANCYDSTIAGLSSFEVVCS